MKKFLPWIIIAVLLRLVLIPLTLHPDFRAVNLAGFLVAQKGEIFSFYDYLSRQPRTDPLVLLYGDNLFIYPPLAYLTHAFFNGLLFHIYPQSAFFTLINDIGRLRLDPGFPWLMYLLKLPYLLADIFGFILLNKMLTEKTKTAGLLFWLFNPVTIYTSYLMGQFDIFVALFVLLSVYFLPKKSWLSSAMLGFGAGFKPFILVLAPFLPGNIWKNTLTAIGFYVLTLIPYLGSPAFRQYALLASQSDKLLFAKIMISGSQFLPVFILGLVLSLWWRYLRPRAMSDVSWLCVPLLLFYAFTHFHPQWFVWVMPLFAILYATTKSARLPIWILIGTFVYIVLSFETSLNFGLFGFDFSFPQFINRFYSAELLISLVRGIFASTAFYLLAVFSEKNKESQ